MLKSAQSLISGSTAASRRIVAGAVADNGAPTTGSQFTPIGHLDAIDLVASCAVGGGSFDVKVWWYYADADKIVYDDDLGAVAVSTAGGAEVFAILGGASPRCASGVYVQTDNFAGGGTASVWLIGRQR